MHGRRCFLEKKLILLRYVFNGILLYKRDIFQGGTKIIEQSFHEYSFVSICTSGHERGDIVILMINLYPVNKGMHFVNSYLLGSNLFVA